MCEKIQGNKATAMKPSQVIYRDCYTPRKVFKNFYSLLTFLFLPYLYVHLASKTLNST